MKLKTKATVLTLSLSGTMAVMLILVSLVAFRQFSLSTAKEQSRVAAEIVRVGLTESMINGVIDKRSQFFHRLAEVEGLVGVRVIRGPKVVDQFGEGLEEERRAVDKTEQAVLDNGLEHYEMLQEGLLPLFRATIPFIADNRGTPNCLECHNVSAGQVLGAITLTISLEHLQKKAIFTIAIMALLVMIFTFASSYIFRRLLMPVAVTAQEVQEVGGKAIMGDFSGRIRHTSSDEVGQIAQDFNKLLSYLQENLGIISRDVASVMQYEIPARTNLLTYTTELVKGLVDVAQFKQAIEEDQTKREVYMRIARIISDEFGVAHYTIYETSSSQNRIKVVVMDGEQDGPCRWCDQVILFQADACRALRTGHIIDSVETPFLCSKFIRTGENAPYEHICIPVIHSGGVGSVVQLITERQHGHLLQRYIPFIRVYLRESAPVVEAKRLLDTLRESALRDALTGLHNRRFLEEYLETLVATARRQQTRLAVMMMDLDHFKAVNDTFGHDAGDSVLRTLSKVLQNQVRASDLVIRYGGEEFMVVLQETDPSFGATVAEKIRVAVEGMSIPIPGGVLHKTISIGLARFPNDSDDFWQVVRCADTALYKAKDSGRNRVVIYTAEMMEIQP